MVDLDPLLKDASGWVPARVELYETSGALQPRHRFETRVVVTATPDGVFTLSYRDQGEWEGDTPRRNLDATLVLPTTEYESLWRSLFQAEVLSLGADFVGEHRARPTAPICHFALSLGSTQVRFDYLPSQVHSFAFFKHRAAIHTMKSLKSLLP